MHSKIAHLALVTALAFGAGAAGSYFQNQDIVGDINLYDNDPASDRNTAIAEGASMIFDVSNDSIIWEGATVNGTTTTLTVTDPTTSTTWTLPAASAAMTLGQHTVTWAQGGTAADALDTQFFIADRPYTVTEINVVWGVAESTGSMDVMVERLQGTEACAAGDDLQAAVVDATGTANTVATPALTATTANLTLAAGNRLCVDLTATPNEITNLVVTVTLIPA